MADGLTDIVFKVQVPEHGFKEGVRVDRFNEDVTVWLTEGTYESQVPGHGSKEGV